MAKKLSKHIHKYIRVKLGDKKKIAYKCALPGCTHYKWLELFEGSLSQCWRCSNTFVIDKVSMTLKRPHCKACTKIKTKPELGKLTEILSEDLLDLLK